MSTDPRDLDTGAITADAIGEHRSTKWRWVALLMALVAVTAIAYSITDFVSQRDDAKAGEKGAKQNTRIVGGQATDLADTVLDVCKAGGKDAIPLREAGLCGKATETKKVVDDQTNSTPTPTAGPPELRYVPVSDQRLDAFVSSSVLRYCASHNDCQGDDAPATTAQQLRDALGPQLPDVLLALCGGSCNGKDGQSITGPKGDSVKGDEGDPAPVVTRSYCNADDEFVFEFSDGSSLVVEDSDCRVDSIVPNPEPTATE